MNKNKSKTPKRLQTSIRHDSVHPIDYLKYNAPSSCEECSHFNSEKEICTFGFNTEPHRKETQKKSYDLRGKMAFCRFHEID